MGARFPPPGRAWQMTAAVASCGLGRGQPDAARNSAWKTRHFRGEEALELRVARSSPSLHAAGTLVRANPKPQAPSFSKHSACS